MSLDEPDLVGLDDNGLDGHVAVNIGRQSQLDGRGKAVGVFDGEAVVFDEKFDVVVLDCVEGLIAAGNFDGRGLRGERVQGSVVETDKLYRNILELLGRDFLDIDKNLCHGIAGCHELRELIGDERYGIRLAHLDAVDEHGICRNIDNAGECVTCSRNNEDFVQELRRLNDDITRSRVECDIVLDGDTAFDSCIDCDVDEEILLVGFDVVDGRKVRGDEIFCIQVDALGTEFRVMHIDDHGGLLLRLQAD